MQPGVESLLTTTAYVGLGSNLDNPVGQVRSALAALSRLPQTCVTACSSLYRTAPIGRLEQPDFINAVARLETRLPARELLAGLLAIEAQHARVRSTPNAPRTLDLDLLLFADEVISEPGLEVPHPRMHERVFVLLPLAEIDPASCVPGRGPVAGLLAGVAAQRIARIDAD
jgi:2-amino-4-hydroxy-6-hydroxymethyldihydropteridine diphosphokinase